MLRFYCYLCRSNGDIIICFCTVSAISTGSLTLISKDELTFGIFPVDNRTAYQVGDSISLDFVIGHVGESSTSNYPTPSVLWLKDGRPARTVSNIINIFPGRLRTSLSFTFEESDAGIYQCVFSQVDSKLFATILRLDTGKDESL